MIRISPSLQISSSSVALSNPTQDQPRIHTTTVAAASASTQLVPVAAGEDDQTDGGEWGSEPQTLDELEARYDVLHSFPGRNANTVLKIVGATEKGQADPKLTVEGQAHKLFLVLGSVLTLLNF